MTVQITRDLIKNNLRLTNLPDTYHRMEETVYDPATSFDAMAHIIEQDAALTVQMLKVANSSLYDFPYKIQSVSRAISIIGTEQLRDLVLAATVIRFFNHAPLDGVNMDSFWCHSVACAIACRAIATIRREPNVERFYVAGLLHDVGRLVIFMQPEDRITQLLKRRDEHTELLYKVEHQVLGFDHAGLGGSLMAAWQLPPVFEEAVRCHHAPDQAVSYPIEAAVVHVADSIANALRFGTSGERYVPPIDPAAWSRLALPESSLEQIIRYTEQHYPQAIEVFLG